MRAYVEGVSTRRVDDVATAMGGTRVSKSEVAHLRRTRPRGRRWRTAHWTTSHSRECPLMRPTARPSLRIVELLELTSTPEPSDSAIGLRIQQ